MAAREGSRAGVQSERRTEVRFLGGLRVLVEGRPVDLPRGAPTVALAVVALRRVVHVEEVTDVLWPDVDPTVARRRLRNVLARVRQPAGPIILRHGDRLELAPDVVVDHHVLDQEARRALAEPEGQPRRARIRELLHAYAEPFLPELLYEDWAQPARDRAERRRDELARALEERAG